MYGKWTSTEGKYVNKGKASIYIVGGTIESDGWTQSDVTNSEDDLHCCIMEHSLDVVMDVKLTIFENSANVGKGAVMLRYQHEWRNGRFKNILKKPEQDHCISIRNKFQMLTI